VLVVVFNVNSLDFYGIFSSGGSGEEADVFFYPLKVLEQLDQPLWGIFNHSLAALIDLQAAIGDFSVWWLINDQLSIREGSVTTTRHIG
jgi:hypothetical protein